MDEEAIKELVGRDIKLYEQAFRAGYKQGFEDARNTVLKVIEEWRPKA